MNEVLKALQDELDSHGVTYHYEYGGKHIKLYGRLPEGERFVVVPLSTSDRRAALNAVSNMRRVFNLGRVCAKSSRAKKHKAPEREPQLPNTVTIGKDPWAALRSLDNELPDHIFMQFGAVVRNIEAKTQAACGRIKGLV